MSVVDRQVTDAGTDRDLLLEFRCGRIRPWEAEVEAWIRTRAADWRFAPDAQDNDPRLGLVILDSDVVGVYAHELATYTTVHLDADPIRGRKLQVAALSSARQGALVGAGNRLSDELFDLMMGDIATRPERTELCTGLVHVENVRSRKLLSRHGFSLHEQPFNERYLLAIRRIQ
jgi:hypothetical protein